MKKTPEIIAQTRACAKSGATASDIKHAIALPSFEDLPHRQFKSVMIDPPWKFSGGTKGRPQHYKRMSDDEIAAMPLDLIAHPDGAHFFVWITSPMGARFWATIAPAWKRRGIRYSGRAFVWVKLLRSLGHNGDDMLFIHRNDVHTGQGFTTRKNAEDCLLFKTGRPTRISNSVHEIIFAPVREHSRKPDEAFDRVERYAAGPYIEMFARQSRRGWTTWGLEAGKFDERT